MSHDVSFRPATGDDSRTCFAIMRGALRDMLRRAGVLAAGVPEPSFEERWPRAVGLFGHLAATCSQWWIAEDRDTRAVGYARAIERDATVELTEFFVLPDARGTGIGRGLLERTFAPTAGAHRFVIATTEPAAVALYLRFGVSHQSTGIDVSATPRAVALPAGYDAVPATLEDVLAIERELLGHARAPEVAFMLADRPAALLRRDGRAVAYAFGPNAYDRCGPVAALDPADLPAALAQLETAAHAAGVERLELAVPLASGDAVTWLLAERGFRVDPLQCLYLADGPWAKLDRYLPFNPGLFL